MKVAVVGATGLVGRKMVQVLQERKFPMDELIPVASEKSIGQEVLFQGNTYTVIGLNDAIRKRPSLALYSAGAAVSREWAPRFADAGTTVIDNSSAWRMEPGIPLIVPEINAQVLKKENRIIANPNCSTIQMVLVLAPLHRKYRIKRIVVSTYQSVTGTGKKAVVQLQNERLGAEGEMSYPYKIDLNCIPQCDVFLDNDYTKEEMKLVHETRKILDDPTIRVSPTSVRVPVMGGHSESVNVEFHSDFDLSVVRTLLSEMPGVVVMDNPSEKLYPMPLLSHEKDEVFVGRIRRDDSQPNTLNMWIVSDNLRKGAATNAVQIGEYLLKAGLI